MLSVNFNNGISFSFSCVFAFIACISWGLENNCTRSISSKNPFQIVILKGLFSGVGSLIIGIILKESISNYIFVLYALLLGFVAYGLSVFFYVLSQRYIGAAKTSSYYSLAPFISVGLSFLIFQNKPELSFIFALIVMIFGIIIVTVDNLRSE